MDFGEQQHRAGRNATGFGIVLGLHLLLGWALVSGLAQRMVDVIKAPIETKIIDEVKPPPPPPPENLPPPKFVPPPPSFVPPPEVHVNAPASAGPTITTTQVAPPPAAVTIAPPPPPVAAPVAPREPVRVPPKIDFANACDRPEYPTPARRAEATGTVVVVYTADTSGVITEATVEKSAGPSREQKMLDRATLEAVKACKVVPGTVDGKPEKLSGRVTYVWRLE